MKSQFASGAIVAAPPAPSTPSVGNPTDGDPLTNVPPTIPGAHWFHSVTQEIVNVITAAGLTPGVATNQLLAAILLLAAPGFSGNSGSLQLPAMPGLSNGLLLQWGTLAVTSGVNSATNALTFPTAFPHHVWFIGGNGNGKSSSGWAPWTVAFDSLTLSGCNCISDTTSAGNNFDSGKSVRWFAIGD